MPVLVTRVAWLRVMTLDVYFVLRTGLAVGPIHIVR